MVITENYKFHLERKNGQPKKLKNLLKDLKNILILIFVKILILNFIKWFKLKVKKLTFTNVYIKCVCL